MEHLSLYELNNLVRGTLELALDRDFWVIAELSEVRHAANGHCYVELIEKDSRSNALIAKARGSIWRNVYTLLAPHFEKITGQRLSPGMKILVQTSVTFHELYGFSLNITDIDPAYTMGDVARRRQEIIGQLTEDGVLTLNKELPLPRLLSRIAVVSSPSAAGYGDFCSQLEQSGYVFTTRLFPATMQGERVEETVISALDAIVAEAERWDAVVIIRGGGAVSDLNGFDTYLLAANVAQFPLPVLTGIGHERDDTVIDLVAHTRLKTPTAVAAFLIEQRQKEAENLDALRERLERVGRMVLESERHRYDQLAASYRISAAQYAGRQRERIAGLTARLDLLARLQLRSASTDINVCRERIGAALEKRYASERHRQEIIGRTLQMASPERILSMGYSMTLRDGHVVRNAGELTAGDRLTTYFAQGNIVSEVLEQ